MSSSPASDKAVYFIRTGEGDITVTSLAFDKRPEEISSFEIVSSGLLTVSERKKVDEVLLRSAYSSVSRYIQDKHYIIRLLLSTFVFMLVYLFLSLVVRDPIPMIDELLLSAVAATAIWIFQMKRDGAMAEKSKLLLELGTMIGNAEVRIDNSLDSVEAFIYEADRRYDPIKLSNLLSLIKQDEELLFFSDDLEEDFKKELREYLNKVDKKSLYFLNRIKKNRTPNRRLAAKLMLAASQNEIDLAFIAFLYRLGL
ncbi:MAG: hypothetical protein K6G51_01530 [Sphaerochaetaceae bacterium]|nr:hypothetical protein [Sphaerochaetaceae bacterium]